METKIDTKQEFESLWQTSFPADPAWNEWFFTSVVDARHVRLLFDADGHPVSGLLMQPYGFKLYDELLPMAYICGVATYRKYRGRGYMSRLLRESLRSAYSRGDALAALIPADRRLFFYYDRFGFASVIYNRIERYASSHAFALDASLQLTVPDYAAFHRLETAMNATVLHSERDFGHILSDIGHDGGVVVAVADTESTPLAMAFVVVSASGEIHVRQALGTHQAALDRALHQVKTLLGDHRPMLVWRPAVTVDSLDAPASLRPRAMMRIVDVGRVLASVAAQFPRTDLAIRVRDDIVPENNALFTLTNGRVTRTECPSYAADRNFDALDVSVDMLTKILFNDPALGRIFNLPATRPDVALMLD